MSIEDLFDKNIKSSKVSGIIESLFEEPDRRLLNRAVVVDVIFDPSNLTKEESLRLQKLASLTPESLFETCPRNAIIARIVNDGGDHYQIGNARLCYPLFPPHICLPVKAGEQVFILDPTPGMENDMMYWIGRVPEPDYVDDINFTHGDRRMMEAPGTMDPETKPELPEFPNGMVTRGSTTLKGVDPYELIFSGSLANKNVTFEPVPRFTRRPGDLALQGSNNTLICLGQNRGWSPLNRPSGDHSNASVELDDEGQPKPDSKIPLDSGAIDIVTGRGRLAGAGDIVAFAEGPTAPGIIGNSRKYEETNKNPVNYGDTGATDNLAFKPHEGDPDFVEDLSRVHLSMKMDGDAEFGLEYPTFMADPVVDQSYVTIKSNEVRIIGREAGSIRIVKEGVPGDRQCVITLEADGTVAIDARKIRIGDGRNNQTFLGKNASEPMVLGASLVSALKKFANNLVSSVDTSIGNIGAPVAMPLLAPAVQTFLSEIGDASGDPKPGAGVLSKNSKVT